MHETEVPPGRIDLHSHLLPGIDDGCRTLGESVACIEELKRHGYAGSVCTPHMGSEWFPHNTPRSIAPGIARLADELRARGIEYRLWGGGELRLTENTRRWLEEEGVPALAGGRAVLVDYWGEAWPRFAAKAFVWLIDRGYRPILAHPERMGLGDRDLERVAAEMAELGVWLQGNLNSLSGGEGEEARRRAFLFLDEGRYRVIASDVHGLETLRGRIAGLVALEARRGAEEAALLIEARPRELIEL